MSEEKKKISQMKMIIDFGDGVFREYFINDKINAQLRRGDSLIMKVRHPKFSEQMLVSTQKYEEGEDTL